MKKKANPKLARASSAKPTANPSATSTRRSALQVPASKTTIQAVPKAPKIAAPLPDKRPLRAPRRPAGSRVEPRTVKGRQKRKGS